MLAFSKLAPLCKQCKVWFNYGWPHTTCYKHSNPTMIRTFPHRDKQCILKIIEASSCSKVIVRIILKIFSHSLIFKSSKMHKTRKKGGKHTFSGNFFGGLITEPHGRRERKGPVGWCSASHSNSPIEIFHLGPS